MIPEPVVVAPERVFEASILEAVRELTKEVNCNCLVVPKFGLDLAFFFGRGERTYVRFIEAKVYAAGRPGGVGFGSPKGEGPQVELLLCPVDDLGLLDTAVRWVLADATRPPGTARYALFDCRLAKAAAMGEVRKGKQNNLRIAALQHCFVTWPKLLEELHRFLFD